MATIAAMPNVHDPAGARGGTSPSTQRQPVSVYAEMLKMALDADAQGDETVSDLVSRALARRLELDRGGDAATRLARALAYDVTLVRLCERLGVEHAMTGPAAGPPARRQVERALAGELPDLRAGLRQA